MARHRNKAIAGRRGDPLPLLLEQLLARAGTPSSIERANSRPWASALFEGRRHVVRLRFEGADHLERLGGFAIDIETTEWHLSGHFVADICIDNCDADADSAWLDLSVLTIEDW